MLQELIELFTKKSEPEPLPLPRPPDAAPAPMPPDESTVPQAPSHPHVVINAYGGHPYIRQTDADDLRKQLHEKLKNQTQSRYTPLARFR